MKKSFRMSLLLLITLVPISISSIPGSALGGNISVSSTPSGALIFIDGIYNPSLITPSIVTQVSPGLHTIKLTLNQYDDWTTTINVVDGSANTIVAALNKTAISISSNPSGAIIVIDSSNIWYGTTPFIKYQVLPGSHTIKLTLNEYDDWINTVNLVEGSTTTVSATLNKTAIYVSSTPSGAGIWLDNQYKGATPFTITRVIPGSHAIKLTLNGYDDWINTVNVIQGSTTTVPAELLIKSSTQNPAPTRITPIITSTSPTLAPTYTTTPYPIATYAPKQTQTPLPFYSGGATPTNTQTTETSDSKTDPSNSPDWTQVTGALTGVMTVIIGYLGYQHNKKKDRKQ